MRKCLRSISLCLVLAFSLSSTVAFAAPGGSIGQGSISVLKGDRVVDTLKGQSPIDESSMLACDGKCMIKSAGISLVAADQAKFAIKNEADTFRLFLRSGSVDFVITEQARKIAFHTPQGVYSVAEVIFNAASDPVVKGSVAVTKDGRTEVSVSEGRLVFATADGMKTINPNEKIVLAISSPPPATPPASGGEDRFLPFWIAGGGGAALVAVGILVAENQDDDDDHGMPNAGNGSNGPGPDTPPRPTPPASPHS